MDGYRRIMLTGGSGFVGSYLAPAVAAAFPQAERTVIARPGETWDDPQWRPIVANLTDEAAVDRAVRETRPDLVLHLAGQSSVGRALGAAEETWRVNFHGAFALASALARHAPEAVTLFTSSASVYGDSLRDGVANEDAALRPLDAYGHSKAAVEAALADLLAPDARLVVARPVNHSGPRQTSKNFVLASFASQIVAIESGRQEPRLMVGDISKARDFLDVRDVVDAYMLLIAQARTLPERVSYFNVASGAPRTIRSLLETLRARAHVAFDVEVDPALLRPSSADIASVACDPARLCAATGWRQRHALEDMLQSLLDYWRGIEGVGA
jgi:GDP-4-dehydro-6-deoxy-D-mannose reductase